mmetsp:Transcript_10640/g.15954  ORF Transcript_10640/g.15954 Transcript_10640/m.15954 type:complete len:170 (-) Transcript_10640:122-631(-)|eukprot:CAMPEP_0194755298 /NCGR_PEP_ID=MMETSP0323_2-20130528/9193_1 /TAXON_ID=2866 ORGANISM="Crypthecodinium cohnii, Strain Seligo" /NCGR_SAMPLE_ID=MMETSP0323_2 /ASSEMBLY_ACC=CAM_ASM_000346 /LENGTH=169 /DNA_ID=CAMNT_0039674299 /DNA_START=19 /DNA_END=528 /DNA_ORIENTATION=+
MTVRTGFLAGWVLLSSWVQNAGAVHACDSEQGLLCPAEAGFDLGKCLKDPSKWEVREAEGEISEGCKQFMALNDACAEELERSCSGMAYSDDTLVCLTQWTAQDTLGSACKDQLPKKEAESSEEVDKEKEEWRRKRKAARQAAQDMMDKEKGQDSKKKRRRRKKASKEL